MREVTNTMYQNPAHVFAVLFLVSVSYDYPDETMKTNAVGTINVLEAIRKLENQVVAILITSDKAYFNSEWVYGYRENDKIGGTDPYSASKAAAENLFNGYLLIK